MSFSFHTECTPPSNYNGPFVGSGGMTAAIVGAIIAAIFAPGAVALILILGAIGYCRWWLFGRLVCLGGNRCIIGLPIGVYSQANQVGFLGKFDTDFSADVLLAPSLLTDSVQDVARTNSLQGHMIQDQRFCDNPPNPLAGDLITMYQNFSNLSFTGENESPADLEGAAGQIDQDNANIGGQGVLTPAQGASIGLTAPGSLNAQGLVVPDVWQANTFYGSGLILDSNGNLQALTGYSQGLSGASEPAWTGLVSITAWSLAMAGGTSFTFTANNSNAVGDVIRLSGFRTSLFFNNQNAKVTAATSTQFTATVTPLTVGSEIPQAGVSVAESGSGVTLGALTMDNAIQWRCGVRRRRAGRVRDRVRRLRRLGSLPGAAGRLRTGRDCGGDMLDPGDWLDHLPHCVAGGAGDRRYRRSGRTGRQSQHQCFRFGHSSRCRCAVRHGALGAQFRPHRLERTASGARRAEDRSGRSGQSRDRQPVGRHRFRGPGETQGQARRDVRPDWRSGFGADRRRPGAAPEPMEHSSARRRLHADRRAAGPSVRFEMTDCSFCGQVRAYLPRLPARRRIGRPVFRRAGSAQLLAIVLALGSFVVADPLIHRYTGFPCLCGYASQASAPAAAGR